MDVQKPHLEDLTPGEESSTLDRLELGDLRDVKMRLSAVLGSCRLSVREILELSTGTVVHLDKVAGEMTELTVNDIPLAQGEIVVLGDVLHVRVAEIIGALDDAEDEYDD